MERGIMEAASALRIAASLTVRAGCMGAGSPAQGVQLRNARAFACAALVRLQPRARVTA
jgi:hypothetical protein